MAYRTTTRTFERISAVDFFDKPGPGGFLHFLLDSTFRYFSGYLFCFCRIVQVFLLPALRCKPNTKLHPLPNPTDSGRIEPISTDILLAFWRYVSSQCGYEIQGIKELEVFPEILIVFGCLVKHLAVKRLIAELFPKTQTVWLYIAIRSLWLYCHFHKPLWCC